ncbi:Hsp20/alpha crystallin family protein [Spirochaetia bacterium 38H-sp]|uniref:Hsp20/alpha crystallin family protein n=1 Tax=Rarispira pelagica TaxID=3141764 RepID=A0ABU9U8G6_9SPIR
MAKIEIDLDEIKSEIKKATKEFVNAVEENFKMGTEEVQRTFKNMSSGGEPYSDLSFPKVGGLKTNIFSTKDSSLVFEFLLPAVPEDSVELEFVGDYLVLSCSFSREDPAKEDAYFYRNEIKLPGELKARYYVPAESFDHDAVKAIFSRGILRVEIPARVKKIKAKKVNISSTDT